MRTKHTRKAPIIKQQSHITSIIIMYNRSDTIYPKNLQSEITENRLDIVCGYNVYDIGLILNIHHIENKYIVCKYRFENSSFVCNKIYVNIGLI